MAVPALASSNRIWYHVGTQGSMTARWVLKGCYLRSFQVQGHWIEQPVFTGHPNTSSGLVFGPQKHTPQNCPKHQTSGGIWKPRVSSLLPCFLAPWVNPLVGCQIAPGWWTLSLVRSTILPPQLLGGPWRALHPGRLTVWTWKLWLGRWFSPFQGCILMFQPLIFRGVVKSYSSTLGQELTGKDTVRYVFNFQLSTYKHANSGSTYNLDMLNT